ncbi:MAG: putative toxin-antitoxin system toxin component, PIN family [Chloroflexi bacterium]|nr:putative toxin-antitoxin system toxin component, PIN family [Chloroflexota bacterium]
MRVVADTNTVISGSLWSSAPRQVLGAARSGKISLFTSVVLLIELEDVLQRPKFSQCLALVGATAHELVLGYAAIATVVEPALISPVVTADPDDDAVLACALAARAEIIVSGDNHLLDLKQYQDIEILTAASLIELITLKT